MDAEQYQRERLQDQLEWHDHKSGGNQRWYKQLQVVVIGAGAMIPLLSGFSDCRQAIRIAVGMLGAPTASRRRLMAARC